MPRTSHESETEARNAQLAALNQQRDLAWYKEFADASALGYIETKSVRMNVYGDWQFTFVVPKERYEDLLSMSKVIGMPIQFYITKGTGNDDD